MVLPSLSLWDLQKIKGVSQRCNARINDYLQHNSSISLVLDIFFEKKFHEQTLDLMSLSEAVISGSTALVFFTRQIYDNSDLDLYVNADRYYILSTGLIGMGFRQTEGPTREGYRRWGSSILEISNFIGGPQQKTVQVIQVAHNPIAAILEFHSSKASLYPLQDIDAYQHV